MSYIQNAPVAEAMQWTGDNLDAFAALVNDVGDSPVCVLDDDGVSLDMGLPNMGWHTVIGPNQWLVTGAYWGTFPGWFVDGVDVLDGDAFAAQFTAAS